MFVELYIKIKKNEMNYKINEIMTELYENYVKNESTMELNINAEKKNNFENFYNQIDKITEKEFQLILDDLFDGVKLNITDTYSRYIHSSYYIKMIKKFSQNLITSDLSPTKSLQIF